MNELILNKTSNLVMPTNYIELDNEEISYVDGGGSYSFKIRISAETVGSLIGAGIATFIATCALKAMAESAKYAWAAGAWGFLIIAAAGVVGGIIGGIIGNLIEDAFKAGKGVEMNVKLASSWLIRGNNTLFTLNF